MSSWLLALLASSQVPYELLALVLNWNVFFVCSCKYANYAIVDPVIGLGTSYANYVLKRLS